MTAGTPFLYAKHAPYVGPHVWGGGAHFERYVQIVELMQFTAAQIALLMFTSCAIGDA